VDIRKIKKVIELLEETGVAEIEIKEGEESLRISRIGPQVQMTHTLPAYAAQAAPLVPAVAAPAPATSQASSSAVARGSEHIVTAPMVGTYYGAPSPGAKDFVAIGEEIKVGQVLCIIEAMKMMNQIESDKAGRVSAMLAKNGESVEFGQPLFIIE
jgi:acetyl-CoA carboxylase biotin carboxyl carrier protein